MSLKNNPLKLFALVFVSVLVFGFGGSIFLRNYKEQKTPEKFITEEAFVKNSYESFPQILNEPVRNVAVGSSFSFSPRVVPTDDTVNLSLLDAPAWLTLQDSVVSGTPNTTGTFSFTLRLERGGEYIDEEFFLVVTDGFDE